LPAKFSAETRSLLEQRRREALTRTSPHPATAGKRNYDEIVKDATGISTMNFGGIANFLEEETPIKLNTTCTKVNVVTPKIHRGPKRRTDASGHCGLLIFATCCAS
jgi:hypothetical protein